jgi:hypothetical protein
LLGVDSEIGDCTAAAARQRPTDNKGIVFYVWSGKEQLDTATEERGFLCRPLGNNWITTASGVFNAVRAELVQERQDGGFERQSARRVRVRWPPALELCVV